MTLSTHWLTQPLQRPHRSLQSIFYLVRHLFANINPLLNVDEIALLLSLYLFSFFLSVWASTPSSLPPSFPLHEASVLCLPELDWRPLYPAFSLVKPDHMVKEWAALLCYPPSSLWVFTWNNSTAAVWSEQGPVKRQRGRDGEPKMDMANLFKHFFREFSTFQVFSSTLKLFWRVCCFISGVEISHLNFELFLFFLFGCAVEVVRFFVFVWFFSCLIFHFSCKAVSASG